MGLPSPSAAANGPSLPLITVDTMYSPPDGSIIRVDSGGDFQQALDTAKGGDVIELTPGAKYQGPFSLPNKTGSDWIIIRSGDGDIGLPGPGTRVSPKNSVAMAKLVSRNGAIITTEPGAHHYRFIGIELVPDDSVSAWQQIKNIAADKLGRIVRAGTTTNLVELAANSKNADDIPHHIIFDRCYLHGDSQSGTRRGIAMNSAYTAVVDSYLSNFKSIGQDSQAIAGWDGPGPYRIANNYLEGAGENLMFGGGDPAIYGMVPSDIEIVGNHFSKPLSWKHDNPGYAGVPWTVKNLLELKNARRVLIDGNLFERNWPQSQNGFAILFTVRNQDGSAPWSVVEDVTFSNNVVRQVAAGINILGRDDIHISQITRNIAIRNNLFEDMSGEFGGNGRLLQLLDGIENISLDRNSAFSVRHFILSEGRPHSGVAITGNLVFYDEAESSGRKVPASPPIPSSNMGQADIRGNRSAAIPISTFPGTESLEKILGGAGLRLSAAEQGETPTTITGMNPELLCQAMSFSDRPAFCQGANAVVPGQ